MQALTLTEPFTRDDYALLAPHSTHRDLDAALTELLEKQVIAIYGDQAFGVDRATATVLCDALSEGDRRDRYRALAERSERLGGHAFASARLWLLCGERERGLDRLLEASRRASRGVASVDGTGLSASELAHTLQLGLERAVSLGRRRRDLHDLHYGLELLSVSVEEDVYSGIAETWRSQLEHDSGLADYRDIIDEPDPRQRLMRALSQAAARYAATPEHERVYAPDEAIRLLVQYVALSIAEASRRLDDQLVSSLPELLEPFAPLSPLIAAIWQNALAADESSARRQVERAQARWIATYEELGRVTGVDMELVSAIRYAFAYGIGVNEAALGQPSAMRWVELLDQEPSQRVTAMYIRKVMQLQQGNLEEAERCRKRAELLALQSNVRQMFNTLLVLELIVHAAAWDLTGVKYLAGRIEPLAKRYEGWRPVQHLAEGHCRRLTGDLPAALEAYTAGLRLVDPTSERRPRSILVWPVLVASVAETLLALERASEARELTADALRECERREMHATAFEVVRTLALAEAKLGEQAQAAARLDALIEQVRARGVTGLTLGVAYEARARVAMWAGDQSAAAHYCLLRVDRD